MNPVDVYKFLFLNLMFLDRVHRRFRELQPELVPRTMSMEATRDLRLPKSLINTLPELKVPDVFSTFFLFFLGGGGPAISICLSNSFFFPIGQQIRRLR